MDSGLCKTCSCKKSNRQHLNCLWLHHCHNNISVKAQVDHQEPSEYPEHLLNVYNNSCIPPHAELQTSHPTLSPANKPDESYVFKPSHCVYTSSDDAVLSPVHHVNISDWTNTTIALLQLSCILLLAYSLSDQLSTLSLPVKTCHQFQSQCLDEGMRMAKVHQLHPSILWRDCTLEKECLQTPIRQELQVTCSGNGTTLHSICWCSRTCRHISGGSHGHAYVVTFTQHNPMLSRDISRNCRGRRPEMCLASSTTQILF